MSPVLVCGQGKKTATIRGKKIMLINVSVMKEFIDYLVAEYNAQREIGRKDSQIKIRLDCVLKAFMGFTGVAIKGKADDLIIEVPLPPVK